MPRLIYIAGSYRGASILETVDNIQRAREAAKMIAKRGDFFFCPHLNSALMDGLAPDSFWLEMDLDILRRCDAVFLMPGWENSEGAISERIYAITEGKPVFFDLAEIALAREGREENA